ncbi:MAG: hypothetical protein D6712_13840 [Chloroflexi bacterium]|nr:MAG: hypothetical protein D6712_13840 [Chloroflexota bacterium]
MNTDIFHSFISTVINGLATALCEGHDVEDELLAIVKVLRTREDLRVQAIKALFSSRNPDVRTAMFNLIMLESVSDRVLDAASECMGRVLQNAQSEG